MGQSRGANPGSQRSFHQDLTFLLQDISKVRNVRAGGAQACVSAYPLRRAWGWPHALLPITFLALIAQSCSQGLQGTFPACCWLLRDESAVPEWHLLKEKPCDPPNRTSAAGARPREGTLAGWEQNWLLVLLAGEMGMEESSVRCGPHNC